MYELRRGVRWQEFGAEELEKRGLVPSKALNPLRIQAKKFEADARPAEDFKNLLDGCYLARDHARLEHEAIHVPGPGGMVAASGMFFDRTDANGAPASMTVNLVPETNRHVLLLSYLRTQREAHQPYIDLFKSHFGLSLRQLTSRLILMRLKSFALRPSLWNSFP